MDDGEDGYEHEVDPLHEQQNEESKLLLRALQLMCEGHFLPNQDILRAQMAYKYSVNLIHTVTNTFNQIGRHCSAFALDTAQALADLILERRLLCLFRRLLFWFSRWLCRPSYCLLCVVCWGMCDH